MTTDRQDRTEGADRTTRRTFLERGARASGLLAAGPLLKTVAAKPADRDQHTLLKNGLIVDGTGKKGFVGNVLIKGAKIEAVSERRIDIKCETIDCAGKVISPGFIDIHSHMDWILAMPGRPEFKSPFTAQGCTTFVAGNCGFAVAGFRKGSKYKQRFNPGLFPEYKLTWDSMAEYFDHLGKVGMSHNLVPLAGHGTARTSMRGKDPSPLSADEQKEVLALLAQAMDHGTAGVSFGLQYSPGIFATPDDIKKVARLVASKDKILTVHARAYSALSGVGEQKLFGIPHNVQALDEMIELAKQTGVRIQYSHLIFAGTTSHKSYETCLAKIDKAIADGVDIKFDTYPYHCGNTGLGVVIPKWFRQGLPDNYKNAKALKRLEFELSSLVALVGLGYDDIQITYANNPELNQYNGMFLGEIARKRKMKPFDTLIDFVSRAAGRGTWILFHRYSNMEIVEALMKHPASLFMSDAVPITWLRNPAAYGTFPLFLQYARDRKLISLEEAVRKMTGANADRMRIKDRGYLRKGLAADITVFDWKGVKDNTTLKEFDRPPSGIEDVFINGSRVKKSNKVDGSITAGVVLRS